MRIIAGTARGRRLEAPAGEATRPTSDRVREAVFNILFSHGGVEDLTVVDLFAGTGAYGLEALSRGAAHATFVEMDRSAADVIAENIATLGFDDRCDVVIGDGLRWIERRQPVDLAFCDPPYDFDRWSMVLTELLADRVVVESRDDIEVPPGWAVLRSRRYASTLVTLLERLSSAENRQKPIEERR